MYKDNLPALRNAVNVHLGLNAGEAPKTAFEKAKIEISRTKTAISKAISLMTMDQYLEIVGQKSQGTTPAEKSAADLVDSYFIPLPSESINAAFARAKRESIAKLKLETAQLKNFSYNDYKVKSRKKAPSKKIRVTNFDNVRVERKRTT